MATQLAPDRVAATVSTRAFPAQTGRPWGRPRGARHQVGHYELTGQYRIDLRDQAPDLFEDVSALDWSTLTWRDVGPSPPSWCGTR